MTRILVDLSEFRDWNGHLTGVQRVVYGIASSLSDAEVDVVFCSYDAAAKQLIRDDINLYGLSQNASEGAGVAPSRGPISARAVALRIYFKIPLRIRRRITSSQKQQIKRAGKAVLERGRSIKGILKRAKIHSTVSGVKNIVTIQQNDVLLICGRLWDDESMQSYIAQKKRDVDFRLAAVVYDLIPIYQQHTFGEGLTEPYARYLFNILTYADCLFPISQSTERDLLRFAQEVGFLHTPKLAVLRLGDDVSYCASKKPLWMTGDEPFAICVGTIEARKNHILLYMAYKLGINTSTALPRLFIIGKPGWLTSDVVYFFKHDAQVKREISVVSNVSDAELKWLYEHACVTVYPSQYEGWGLPVGESLCYGTPCIASNSSSMPEITAGLPDLVDYISPYDSRELMEKLHIYVNPGNVQKKRKQIRSNYKARTWAMTAEALLRYLQEHDTTN